MNKKAVSFGDIQQEVELAYPRILSTVFKRCRTERANDLGSCHKSIVDLSDVIIRFLSIVQIQECNSQLPDLKSRLPQNKKSLNFLKRPSMGGWLSLFRILSNLDVNKNAVPWTHAISSWYNTGKTAENRSIIETLDDIEGVNVNTKTRSPHAEILSGLVNYRNKQFAHAANQRREKLREQISRLERTLVYILRSASFLEDMGIVYADRVEVAQSDQWLIHGVSMEGVTEEPTHVLADERLDLDEVYVGRVSEGEFDEQPISLAPFVLRKTNQETGDKELFVYNDAWRTKLEFLSYESGSRYYHEELHRELEDLVNLDIQPGSDEQKHQSLSSEEKAKHAEQYFKRAMVHREEGRYEDAIEALEQSIQYERRPETFLEIARLQDRLGDPADSVLQTLQYAFDLEPGYEEAEYLREQIESRQSEETDSTTEDDSFSNQSVQDTPVIGEALLPPKLRKYSLSVFTSLFFLWYLFSATVEYYYSGTAIAASRIGLFVLGTLMVSGGTTFRNRLVELEASLSLQLDGMRLERFESWYRSQLQRIFGLYHFRKDGWIDWKNSLAEERPFYVSQTIVIIFSILLESYIIGTFKSGDIFIFLKRSIDIFLVSFFAVPGVRLIIMTSLFVRDFSKLSLKPTLTKLQGEGLLSFGTIFVLYTVWGTLILFTVLFGLILISEYGRNYNYVVPVFAYSVPTSMFSVWSIGMPILIRSAMINSKRKVINRYASHLEGSFNDFLNNPSEKTLSRYNWLVENRHVISEVVTWPLSIFQTAMLVLCNLLAFSSAIIFSLYSLGYTVYIVDLSVLF